MYLDGTHLVRGDYEQSPLELTITFPSVNTFQYHQMQSHNSYLQQLGEYLENLLQFEVRLLLAIEPASEETAIAPMELSGPQSDWNKDRHREQILQILADTFETIYHGSYRRQGDQL